MIGAWLLVAVVVGATVAGDVLQSLEMKRHGEVRFSGGRLGRALAYLVRRRYLALAVFCMAVSFFAFLKLLSFADLSFAVPASAGSFVLETILARLVLGEDVNMRRWLGAGLVAVGVAFLAA
ncbi:MAG TPA: EamA family transporter [Bryobacteraceae bacterium]|nr:EamA family transporter [Bryobacteraceae bacterium]